MCFAVFGGRFGFVKTRQASVVTLVESPCFRNGDVLLIEARKDRIQSFISPFEDGSESNVEFVIEVFQRIRRLLSFFDAYNQNEKNKS